MKKHFFLTLTVLLLFLLACQAEEPSPPETAVAEATAIQTSATDTPAPATVVLVTNTPPAADPETATPTPTLTPSPTPSPSATFTPSPTPTNTPQPSERLSQGETAYFHGRFALAEETFNALFEDPGASDNERKLGLYWRGRSELTLGRYSEAESTFAEFTAAYPDDDLTSAAHFNRALALETLNRYTDTVTAYEASLPGNEAISPYIYERLGDFALLNEAYPQAAEWYLAALNTAPTVSYQVHLREGIAEAERGAGNLDSAVAQYQAILNVAEIANYRAKILRLLGETYAQFEQPDLALEQYNAAIYTYPDTYEAYLALVNVVQADAPVDEFQRGYVNYYGGNVYQPALAAFERYLAGDDLSQADEALWLAGWSARALGQYDTAVNYFQRVIDNYPNSRHWSDAHLQIGRTYGWAGRYSEGMAAYREFAAAYPNHSQAAEALWRAAVWQSRLGDEAYSEATAAFLDVAARYPRDAYADDALQRAGLTAFLADDLTTAEEAWRNLLTRYPGSEYAREASYWQAKLLLSLGETMTATQRLEQLAEQPLNYFALRAEDQLAGQRPYAPSVPITLEIGPTEQSEAEAWLANWLGLTDTARLGDLDLQIENDPRFIRAEALYEVGLKREALNEYETLYEGWRDNAVAMYQLSRHFRERGAYRLSILSGLRVSILSPATDPADVPTYIRRLIYPTYYADLVIPESDRYGLDPALVFALIRQESLYDPDAISIADARGLMQVIPPTGADIAERKGQPGYSSEQLWLPYLSVEFGTWYLKQMQDFFGGNQFAALAAYNAGPGRVQGWIQNSDDLDAFVATLTLSEPQEYIRRIYLNVANYRDIYGVN